VKRQKNTSLPLFTFLGVGIVALEIIRRRVMPKLVPGDVTVTTRSFAEKYKVNRERAESGDLTAMVFIQSANRRLQKIRDDATAHHSDTARRFLLELSLLGVTEKDYVKES
jgi:hypothetical protein